MLVRRNTVSVVSLAKAIVLLMQALELIGLSDCGRALVGRQWRLLTHQVPSVPLTRSRHILRRLNHGRQLDPGRGLARWGEVLAEVSQLPRALDDDLP